MSNIEVWATGRPMNGFTMESVRANVQGLFPKATDVQLARFTAGTRFVVTRVPDEEAAKRVVAALTKAGVLSEYIRPAPKPSPELAGVDLADDPPEAPMPQATAHPRSSAGVAGGQPATVRPPQQKRRPTVPDSKVGSYVKKALTPGERVEYVAKVSLWPYAPAIFAGIVFTFAMGIGLLILLAVYITYISTELAITNKRVIAKFGFISRKTIEMNIRRIESVQVDQGIFGRMCDFGSIVLAGAGNPQAPVPNISRPLDFRRAFHDSQEAAVGESAT